MNDNPNHIAIIMDGNRRWSQKNLTTNIMGYRNGTKVLKRLIYRCSDHDIKELSIFAFSTENWKRMPNEVDVLFKLFKYYLKSETAEMNKNNVIFNFVGIRDNIDESLANLIDYSENLTSNNNGLKLNIAIDYGGKVDLTYSFKKIAYQIKNDDLKIENIDDKTIKKNLISSNVNNIDMLIRTGGEKRISNFMLWQLAYSELFFTNTLWPDFSDEEFDFMIKDFRLRDRRYGSTAIHSNKEIVKKQIK